MLKKIWQFPAIFTVSILIWGRHPHHDKKGNVLKQVQCYTLKSK